MKILMTGGTGFIGSHLADAFIDRGDVVTVFDASRPVHEFRSHFVEGDLRNRQAVEAAIRGNDFVIHAAGLLGTHETVLSATGTSTTNILGSLHVIDAVNRYGNHLINISKPNVWLNPYSITKDCVEKFCFMYVDEFDTKIAIVKLYNVYGPRQKYLDVRKAIPTWIVDALRNKPVEVFGTGAATMDLVHTQDVNDGTICILENFDKCRLRNVDEISNTVCGNFPAHNEQILELGSGHEISVNDVVGALRQALGIDFEVRHLPMRRGEIDGTSLRANISRLTDLTGYRPRVSLQEGLKDTIEYYKKHLPQIELASQES